MLYMSSVSITLDDKIIEKPSFHGLSGAQTAKFDKAGDLL
jgi:hypothetical protein